MTAGEGGSPSGGFSYPVWRSGNRLHRCRNPRTGAPMQIKASAQPKFKAGKGLKDAVN